MTTPGGPCSSSCSAPHAVRAHMSASGSRGNTGIPARSQSPRRCRRRQDIVLSASASIHQMSLRRVAEAQPILCRSTAGETALARASTSGGERRRLASHSTIPVIIFRRAKAELATVKPHPMHDHCQLARHRNDGTFVAALVSAATGVHPCFRRPAGRQVPYPVGYSS